jgi:hypothetical protein
VVMLATTTGMAKDCHLFAKPVLTPFMPISSVREISHSERYLSGKTGQARVSCQYALMCRTAKPK